MKRFVLVLFWSLMACESNPMENIKHLQGYWEIVKVEKNGQTIKSFNINPDIDYFIISDFSKGIRKKLKPRFDGNFETSKDALNFKIEVLDNNVYLIYSNALLTLKEQVEKVTKNELILTNSEGFKYTYKPYEPLQINE